MKRALILGVGGQDGSFMADLLLEKGYEVHGFHRRTSTGNLSRIEHLRGKVTLHHGDICDTVSVMNAVVDSEAEEIYNFADQDNVDWSYKAVGYQIDVTAKAVASLLESVRQVNPPVKVFQPISATVFGDAPPPQNELTHLNPLSPYACAKAAAWHLCKYYRQVHGMFICCAVFFNHDSERRGDEYLLHRLLKQAKEHTAENPMTVHGGEDKVDIGYAPEYVEAAWRIMQHSEPDDFCVGTGYGAKIRLLAVDALKQAGNKTGAVYSAAPYRPGPRQEYIADCAKIEERIGWRAENCADDVLQLLSRRGP